MVWLIGALAWAVVACSRPATRAPNAATRVPTSSESKSPVEPASSSRGVNATMTARTSGATSVIPPVALPRVSDSVVSAGLRWMVRFEPRSLLAKLNAAHLPLLDASRLADFEHSVGLHVSETSEAAIAGFDYSTLYVARVIPEKPDAVNNAATRFATRLDETPVTQNVLQVPLLSGVRQAVPQHFVQLDALSMGWSEGDPSTLKAAALAAQQRLSAAPALRGASLGLLPPDCHDGDLVIYLPGPITSTASTEDATSGVIALVLAASLGFELNGQTLAVDGCIVGDWDKNGQARVQSLLDALLAHRFVSLLALSDAERQAQLSRDGDVVRFEFVWRADHTFTRARALLDLDSNALLGPAR